MWNKEIKNQIAELDKKIISSFETLSEKMGNLGVKVDDNFAIFNKKNNNLENKLEDHIVFSKKESDKTVNKVISYLNEKLSQLKLFKNAEEIISENVFSNAIINELVKRAFVSEDNKLAQKIRELSDKKQFLDREFKRLAEIKKIGTISIEELNKKLRELDKEYNRLLRIDEEDEKAKRIKHTIDFIKCLI